MNKVEIYRKLNEGKKRKLVFQLTSRGFASEVNNMLSAILYCLVYDIEFIIYSRSWLGRNNIDWNDYFLPFCKEYKTIFFYRHSVFKNNRLEKMTTPVRKLFLRNHLDAYDIFKDIRSPAFLKKDFNIPELNIKEMHFMRKRYYMK